MVMKPGGPPLPTNLPGRLSRDRGIINLQQRAARRQAAPEEMPSPPSSQQPTRGPMPAPQPPSGGPPLPTNLPGRLARDRGIINLQQRAARRQPAAFKKGGAVKAKGKR